MDKKERNWKFDYLKGISCLIVVLLHFSFPLMIGEAIIYGMRFSVPIFFMITGYFCISKPDKWLSQKALSLARILVITEACYFVFYSFRSLVVGHESAADAFGKLEGLKHPIRTIFCGSYFNGTLWYLYAGIWTYVIYLVLRKIGFFDHPVIWVLTILSLVVLLVIGNFYVQHLEDRDANSYLFRNAITFGLPLTLTGSLFRRFEENLRKHLLFWMDLLILAAGFAIMVAEYIFSRIYMDFHFSTFVICIGLFLLAFNCPDRLMIFHKPISFIGHELSLWIYLVHMFFGSSLGMIAKAFGADQNLVFLFLRPFLTITLSILAALLIRRIRRSISEKKVAA